MKKIIIINGYGTCGKDEFVKMFAQKLPIDVGIKNISTVDEVKEISKHMGWDGQSKTDKDRRFWSNIKAIWTEYNDGVFIDTNNKILASDDIFFFVHCREPKEIQKFVDYYKLLDIDCYTLLIQRKGVESPDNDSDRSVLDYDYDCTIDNDNTLDDLSDKADSFYTYITV